MAFLLAVNQRTGNRHLKESDVATNKAEQRLSEILENLESQAEHQQSKGSDCITLTEDEYMELFAAMREAALEIDSFTNGSI